MAEKLDEEELGMFEEFLRVNMIQTDTVTQLVIEKGIITEEELYAKLKQVQGDYEIRRSSRHLEGIIQLSGEGFRTSQYTG